MQLPWPWLLQPSQTHPRQWLLQWVMVFSGLLHWVLVFSGAVPHLSILEEDPSLWYIASSYLAQHQLAWAPPAS